MEIKWSDHLQKAYFFTAITGLLMIACLFIYAGIIEYVRRAFAPFDGFTEIPNVDYVRIVLVSISAFLIVCIGFIKKRLLAQERIPVSRDNAVFRFSFMIKRLVIASVLGYLFSELIALFGLTLFLGTGTVINYYLFMALSLVSFITHFPRYSRWEAQVSQSSRPGYSSG